LHNAIVWMDARIDVPVAEISRDDGQNLLRDKTWLPLATYFYGLTLPLLLDLVVGAMGAVRRASTYRTSLEEGRRRFRSVVSLAKSKGRSGLWKNMSARSIRARRARASWCSTVAAT
jgi:hypothetical protein